ncbi:hypothetical protein EVAR_4696_1 [Eumeta japonica]|uniref:Uncharacterized protein n=1 Tax=Eumeta variegata TaxID=151549 RepID=A0A4C1WN19_EUMVA|nr:hypothetical protein EVAR_4696_1 [Eumeta japonica]
MEPSVRGSVFGCSRFWNYRARYLRDSVPVTVTLTVNNVASYADIAKCDKNNTRKIIPNIVIKAKDKKNKDTVNQVKCQLLGDIAVPIKKLQTNKSGDVTIKCKNKEDVERTTAMLRNKLINDYQVEVQTLKAPRMRILDVQNDMNLESLTEDIKNRNPVMLNGTWPSALKSAVIVPIFKNGSHYEPSNYRPISLISNIAKVLEKLVTLAVPVEEIAVDNAITSSEAEIICTESEIISRDPEIISTPLNVEISTEQVIVPVEQEALNQSQLSRTPAPAIPAASRILSTRPNTEDEEDAEPPRTAGRASTHRVDRRRRRRPTPFQMASVQFAEIEQRRLDLEERRLEVDRLREENIAQNRQLQEKFYRYYALKKEGQDVVGTVLIERSSGGQHLAAFKPLKTPPTQDTNFRILSSMSSIFEWSSVFKVVLTGEHIPTAWLGLLSGILGRCFFKRCYDLFGELMDALALLNGAINFVLYCSMSRQFRTTFGALMRARCGTTPRTISHTELQTTYV